MKIKKIFAVLCVCAIAVFTFTACGGNNSETAETDTAETSAADTVNDSTTENVDGSSSETQTVSFSGTYVPQSITDSEGNEMTYGEYVALAAETQGYEEGTDEYDSFVASNDVSYLFADGGTVTAKMGENENSGTYVFDGSSSLTTTFSGVDTNYAYDAENDTLTASDADSGITIVMARA